MPLTASGKTVALCHLGGVTRAVTTFAGLLSDAQVNEIAQGA
jgi:hypothetical protein